ncbi:cytochrome P450 [Streptomyces acidiscabies]|uniref:Cytochrome P450 n=1 Tax=Streptomyces acidiscabies TaxID=42234 RepID=A0AAP6EK44_9ACTN|nr:cytochrome P450 [Streptomyces acidiscabies]MBP5942370.1 cytochrome P450 [Streptomyces sp. LBUM 1476]MBZ3913944.1 cytochrome P450 [Streptomyces acidiscabies]MDX2965897.1 cytochrome P450 [Streptomyces acidiscabies]MDX3025275.1 cytochrome P450 [Streptomyces acidiscabies]MDX3795732.1 cytochrome P450 [Streptomyces acidiscabies]
MTIGDTITIEALDTDPYPLYRRLREEEPVSRVPLLRAHLVTRWADVHRVCRDAEAFGAAVHDSPLSQVVGPNLVHSDGEYHRRLRAPLTAGLRPPVVRRSLEHVVRDCARALLRERKPGEEVDLLSAYALPLAVRVLQKATGLPELPVESFAEWVAAIAGGAANYEQNPAKQHRAEAASAAVDEMLGDCLRRRTQGTLLAGLAAGGASFAELAATVKLLILGGIQEPRDLFAHALTARLTVPGTGADLAELVEEALRYGSPVGTVTRRVTTPAVLSGTRLAPGTLVLAVLASANRDPRCWDAPDEFRVGRAHNHHLAFSAGAHACVGATLGRTQVRIALEELLTAYPGVRLTEQPVFRGWEFRGPASLKVRLAGAP